MSSTVPNAIPEPELSRPTSQPSVLLVDDYADTLEMWALYLRSYGYAVFTASDGDEALRIAMAQQPDVVILDLDLPAMSGYQAARRLRDEADTAEIPLIGVIGYSSDMQTKAAREAGFASVLVKPCDPPTLVSEIERVLASGGLSAR